MKVEFHDSIGDVRIRHDDAGRCRESVGVDGEYAEWAAAGQSVKQMETRCLRSCTLSGGFRRGQVLVAPSIVSVPAILAISAIYSTMMHGHVCSVSCAVQRGRIGIWPI